MAENDWSQPSSWSAGTGGSADYWTPQNMAQAQPMGMWGAPQGGMQSPPGMQQAYGSLYGGPGGGMGYGGGYGMQASYAAPGGPGAYAMPQQSQMMQAQPWSQQQMMQASAMQAPQTQAAGASQVAPQAAAPTLSVDPREIINKISGGLNIGGNTSQNTTFTPWTPLGNRYEGLWAGKPGSFTGAEQELAKQQKLGPLGFDPSSEAGLKRMEELARAGNPFFAGARDAVTGITSGQNRINTGGMFGQMYDDPGITGMGQYQNMANRNAIGNAQQYNDMINRDAVGGGRFEDLYKQPGVNESGYNELRNRNAVGTGRMEDIYGGPGVGTRSFNEIRERMEHPGSLSQGMFGQVARGDRVDSNPYREKAIQDAMNQTSDQVKATMSSRGRYGSDAYGDAMGRALGEVATTARMQGYDTDIGQMMQGATARSGESLSRAGMGLQAAQGVAGAQGQNIANQMGAAQSIMGAQGQNWQNQLAAMQGLTGAQSQNVGQRMGAAQGLAGLQGTNAAQRLAQIQGLSGIQGQNYQSQLGALGQMNAAQQMANQQRMAAAQGMTGVQGQNLQNRLQGAGMAPAMNQMRYDDATKMLQAGASREAMAQQQRDFGWNQLQQYRSMLGNLPGSAGQVQSQTQQPWWQTAAGIAAGAAGIWGGMGGA